MGSIGTNVMRIAISSQFILLLVMSSTLLAQTMRSDKTLSLSLDDCTVSSSRVAARVLLKNIGVRDLPIFNPWKVDFIPSPFRIDVVDENGNVVANYACELNGSRRSVLPEDWIRLPQGAIVGFNLNIPLNSFVHVKSSSGPVFLRVSLATASINSPETISIVTGDKASLERYLHFKEAMSTNDVIVATQMALSKNAQAVIGNIPISPSK